MSGYLNNTKKVVLNPFDGSLEQQHDEVAGTTTRNATLVDFIIQAGFTRLHPNLTINPGRTVTVQPGGELIVI